MTEEMRMNGLNWLVKEINETAKELSRRSSWIGCSRQFILDSIVSDMEDLGYFDDLSDADFEYVTGAVAA